MAFKAKRKKTARPTWVGSEREKGITYWRSERVKGLDALAERGSEGKKRVVVLTR